MTEAGLKLTTYFGERDRSGGHLLADELLDLYGRNEIAASILLRGIEGFGVKHSLRTDRLLTMSEDLPVVAIAVDHSERIERLLDDIRHLPHPGLVTVENALLADGSRAELHPPDHLHEATKLSMFVGRHDRHGGEPLFVKVCALLHRERLAGATVLLGVDGTTRGRRARASLLGSNQDVPMMIVSVGPRAEIERVLPQLGELLDDPMITLERVRVCKRDGRLLADPITETPGSVKLMIHASESARDDGHPMHRSIVRKLRAAGIAGATTVRGVWGFHGDHPPHGDKLVQLHRHVPTVTTVIDTPERIGQAFAIVDAATRERGLVTSEVVPIVRSSS